MPPDEEAIKNSGTDFTNMVIFCSKVDAPLSFRSPITSDFLRSSARQEFLHLSNSIDETKLLVERDAGIMRKNQTMKLARWHDKSALGHWWLMRTAIPASVWERW